ncbi:glycosyltransferase [Methylocapsa polymorpha]|uniref:Glycosyltransferase n=1 Tax=Methylocapsa polymorpha TaxID=3080828 RepID=A0ABZ0HRR0_9HYPH|nr:glycosyltransferase [Methylocapsa sp. RX1]
MTNPVSPVTVFILSWNRPHYLWTCLDSLYRYTRCPVRFILVDNNSDDPGVREVVEGFGRRGMFHAIEWASTNSPTRLFETIYKYRHLYGDYFACIESDVVIFDTTPCWLSQLCALMDENPRLALLGSYIDTSDFIDPETARNIAPQMPEERRAALIKAQSPERCLPVNPPNELIIEPFNPPGRLVMLRTQLLDIIPSGPDHFIYKAVKEAGLQAGISTKVRHRHLSLLNFFDYPEYDTKARDRFHTSSYNFNTTSDFA